MIYHLLVGHISTDSLLHQTTQASLNFLFNLALTFGLLWLSLHFPVLARILLNHLTLIPHSQYLIIFDIWSCPQVKSWGVILVCYHKIPVKLVLPEGILPDVSSLQFQTTEPPTLILNDQFPLFFIVFEVEPVFSLLP